MIRTLLLASVGTYSTNPYLICMSLSLLTIFFSCLPFDEYVLSSFVNIVEFHLCFGFVQVRSLPSNGTFIGTLELEKPQPQVCTQFFSNPNSMICSSQALSHLFATCYVICSCHVF